MKKPFAENSLFSIGLSIVVLVLPALGVVGSIRTQGQRALNMGVFGLCSLLVSLVTVRYGIRLFREKDRNYVLARIGTGVGIMLILAWLVTILLEMRG